MRARPERALEEFSRRYCRVAHVHLERVTVLVVSHWALDAVVHISDLPLTPGSKLVVGLGPLGLLGATLAVEGSLFVLGVLLYLRSTQAVDSTGRWAAGALVALLILIYAANLVGPAPPDVAAIACTGQAQWLLVAFAYCSDRHRLPVIGFADRVFS